MKTPMTSNVGGFLVLAMALAASCSAEHSVTPLPNKSGAPLPSVPAPVAPVPAAPALVPPTPVTEDQRVLFSEKDLALSSNGFAFAFFRRLKSREGNLFFSPRSIHRALAMVYGGATGKTRLEMTEALRFPADNASLGTAEQLLGARLSPGVKEDVLTLRTADRIWVDKRYALSPAFAEYTNRYFGAPSVSADFMAAPEESRSAINRWVEEQTVGKIADLLPLGTINSRTGGVLVDAIYLKAKWNKLFDKASTRVEPFTTDSGKVRRVPMMNQTEALSYAESQGTQVVELPYRPPTKELKLSMIAVLPAPGKDLSELEQRLNARVLSEWQKAMQPAKVDLYLPRFEIRTNLDIKPPLSQCGIEKLFAPGLAELDGMLTAGAQEQSLYVETARHSAFVKVDEAGTEAAAATAIAVAPSSSGEREEIYVFRADRPFLFLIIEKRTRAILFMGRVADPSSQ